MRRNGRVSTLETVKNRFRELVERRGLLEAEISVSARPLTPEEAIGTPERRDFPIILGVERVIEASVLGSRGHAFTDTPADFRGTLRDVLDLSLSSNRNRALFIAVLNAALGHLGEVEGVLHCRNGDPERCARHIADFLHAKYGTAKVALVGLNPAIGEALVKTFGAGRVCITDLNPQTIGTHRFGVEILDGAARTGYLVDFADVVLLTGTTLVNGTFDDIWSRVESAGKTGVVYGVTAAGVSALAGIDRICPYGRDA